MPTNGLGAALRRLRERRILSVREVGKLSEIDHAYIHRLETGEKASPSMELVNRLLKVLKTGERENAIVRWLVDHPDAREDVVELAIDDETIDLTICSMAAGAVHRGTTRPDAATAISRARRALED